MINLLFLNSTFNSFPTIDEIFWQSAFSLVTDGGHCLISREMVQQSWVQIQAKRLYQKLERQEAQPADLARNKMYCCFTSYCMF